MAAALEKFLNQNYLFQDIQGTIAFCLKIQQFWQIWDLPEFLPEMVK